METGRDNAAVRRAALVLVALVPALVLVWIGCDREPSGSRDPEIPTAPPATAQPGPAARRAHAPDLRREDAAPPASAVALEPAAAAAAAGEVPEDERGTGDCTLTLCVMDATTRERVETDVRLWRLGVAATEDWSAGDQVQRAVRVPLEGIAIGGLPAGRYRVEVDAVGAASDDPPEFVLPDAPAQTAFIVVPREAPVRCVVVDENGVPLRTARLREGTSVWRERRPQPAPAWATPRRRGGSGGGAGAGILGHLATGDRTPAREVTSGPDGFETGRLPGASRVATHERTDDLLFEGRSLVRVRASDGASATPEFVGISVPLSVLAGHVRLEDGRPALDAGAAVSAECVAVPRGSDGAAAVWRTIPVHVRVEAAGFAPLEFDWRADDPPRADVRLTAEPSRDSRK
jgi:hypothetical protein